MRALLLLGIAASTIPAMASAQSDVVVMRRVLAPPTRTPTPAVEPTGPADPGYYNWQVTAWQQSGTCGQIGNESRSVSCVQYHGGVVADSNCTGNGSGAKPIASRPALVTSTCSYSWQESAWSSPTTTCGTSTISRDVTCLRSDGTVADGGLCPTPVPPSTQSDKEASGCGFVWTTSQWGAPSASCGDSIETRSVSCSRTDGAAASASQCKGDAPTTTQHVYVACTDGGAGPTGLAWATGPWGSPVPACGATVATRNVTCQDASGTIYADAQCSGTKPASSEAASDYSTCTDGRTNANPYGWTAGSYGNPSTTCGTATLTRSVTCTDGSGNAVADASCTGTKPEATTTRTETSGCSYQWKAGQFSAPIPACGPTVETRAVQCMRSDGVAVGGASCYGEGPSPTTSATDFSACTYAWISGEWSEPSTMCGSATQTRSVSCQRVDGTSAGDSQCDAATRPADSQNSYQTGGCGVKWDTGAYEVAPACGATTETRTVTCLRSDGQTVADDQCAPVGAKPPTSQTASDYSTCTYQWSVGTYPPPTSTCGTTTQTRSVTCLRSDNQVVADDKCADQGAKPDASETTTQTSSCTYSWSPEPWANATPACGASTHSRTVDCLRSDGTPVASSFCSAAPNEPATSEAVNDYGTCSYKWAADAWQGAAGCGDTVTQTRRVYCQRSNGDDVTTQNAQMGYPYCSQASMIPATQPITDYSSCTYSWQIAYGQWSGGTCSSTATRNNTVTCVRQDGTPMADQSYCNASTKPALTDTGNFTGCTYSGTYGAPLGVCTAPGGGTTGTQTTTLISCQRSDGTDYTSQNAAANYAQCAKASTQTCTMPVAAAVTCPSTPTSRSGITNASSYTQTPYSGGASAGIALAKSMDGSKKYYLVLQYAAQPKYNIVYAGDVAPNFSNGTFSNVSTDGYYVCTGAK